MDARCWRRLCLFLLRQFVWSRWTRSHITSSKPNLSRETIASASTRRLPRRAGLWTRSSRRLSVSPVFTCWWSRWFATCRRTCFLNGGLTTAASRGRAGGRCWSASRCCWFFSSDGCGRSLSGADFCFASRAWTFDSSPRIRIMLRDCAFSTRRSSRSCLLVLRWE